MKKFVLSIVIVFIINNLYSQSFNSYNYILIRTPFGDNKIKDTSDLAISNSRYEYQYYDGLGREVQTVRAEASPNGKDLIDVTTYDEMGRIERRYLEFEYKNSLPGLYLGGAIGAQKRFYEGIYPGDQAYIQYYYEPSVLNRKEKEVEPGPVQIVTRHNLEYTYLHNTEGDHVIIWRVNESDELVKGGYYPSGRLTKTVIKDEDGWETTKFTDKGGRLILERRQITSNKSIEVYYIYDVYGRLRYVLQPKAVALLKDKPDGVIGKWYNVYALREYGFYYQYDERGRIKEEQLPGGGPEYYIYDKSGLLIFYQDGKMRKQKKWMFYAYDSFGREVIRGFVYPEHVSYKYMSSRLDKLGNIRVAVSNGSEYDVKHLAYLRNTDSIVLIEKRYYDGYGYLYSHVTDYKKYLYPDSLRTRVDTTPIGELTVRTYRILGGQPRGWRTEVYWYDKKLRKIYSVSQSADESRYVSIARCYDQSDRLIIRREQVMWQTGGIKLYGGNWTGASSSQAHEHIYTLTQVYDYDREDRLVGKYVYFNDTLVYRVENEYDYLGRVKRQVMMAAGGKRLEIERGYTIRSWMKEELGEISGGEVVFSQKLHYFENDYRGNITSMDWSGYGIDGQMRYEFSYDGLSRLMKAVSKEGGDYSTSYTYDENGNIKKLKRKSDGRLMDDLSYAYRGNKVIRINERYANAYKRNNGFVDVNTGVSEEYKYDWSGNLVKDLNKGIDTILYDYHNQPVLVKFDDGREQRFYYDYSGSLLRMERIDGRGNLIERRDYAGSFVFEGERLSEVLTGEGRLIPWRKIKPDFFVRDHLGSVRAVISGDGRVLEANSYYPYGLRIDGLSSSNYYKSDVRNRYKYNGKELFEDLQWLNYGARFYDPAVGRWWSRDPKAEKGYGWSPYVYTFDSPIGLLDPDGNWPWEPRNVREARRFARQTGGRFEKWRGKNGYWYASVMRASSDNSGVFVNARVFKPNIKVYTGNNLLLKAYLHYQFGGRKDLYVSTSALNFNFVRQSDLRQDKNNPNLYSVNLFALNKFSQTSLTLGKVKLEKIEKGEYKLKEDYYDFNIERGKGLTKRNIATFIAGLLHGPVVDNKYIFIGPSMFFGGPFYIKFIGTIKIK